MFGSLLFYLFLIKFTIGNTNIPSTTTENGTTVPITVGSESTIGVSKSTTTKITDFTLTPTVPARKIANEPQTTKGAETQYSNPKVQAKEMSKSGLAMTIIFTFIIPGIFVLGFCGCIGFAIYRYVRRGKSAHDATHLQVNIG